MEENLNKICQNSGWNKEAILKSKKCGCFYCIKIFDSDEIINWIYESENSIKGPGTTARCPHCDIDSVLPESNDYILSIELLTKMNKTFFNHKE